MKIGFCKLGKSCKWRRSTWNSNGGDNEPLALLQALANNNPRDTFYIIGRSDWSKMDVRQRRDLFPNENVVDCWKDCDIKQDNHRKGTYADDIDPRYDTWLLDYFDRTGIELVHSVILVGQMCIANLRGITRLKSDATQFSKPLVMGVLYALPIMRWINERKPRYIEVITDQLYDLSQPRDLIHFPMHSLGQLDCTYETLRMLSYEDQTHIITKVPSRYAPIETLFCVGRRAMRADNDRDIDFAVVCNERRPSRFPMLREWVLNQFSDVSIYGRWAEGRGSKTLDAQAEMIANDARFKGSLHLDQLHNLLRRVKTTFVVPQHRGGVTSKWVEMLHAGVVPFFHPKYDTQRHIKVPEFLRPTTPRELRDRVRAVLDDDSRRKSLIETLCSDLMHDGYYDGSIVARDIIGLLYADVGRDVPELESISSNEWIASNSSLEELFT